MYTQMTTVCLWGSVNQGIIHVHRVSIDCKNGEMTWFPHSVLLLLLCLLTFKTNKICVLQALSPLQHLPGSYNTYHMSLHVYVIHDNQVKIHLIYTSHKIQ